MFFFGPGFFFVCVVVVGLEGYKNGPFALC